MKTVSILVVSLAAITSGICADPPKLTPDQTATQSDEVVRLSDFTVQLGEDRGYAASETMSGSRVKTKIIDLPYSVNVLTSEFFSDFAMFDLDDSLTQIGSFTGLSAGGSFTLRGFSSSSQLRDGFNRIGRYGTSNIDRIEIIKGSSAAIYGRTSPGGMINMISKEPRARSGSKLSYNFGSYSTMRVVGDSTGTLADSSLGRTTYLVTASYSSRAYDQPYTANRHQEYMSSIKHTFKDGSSLLVSAEYFLQILHSPQPSAPVVIDQNRSTNAANYVAIGYATALAYSSAYGPNSEFNRDNRSFTLAYDKKISEVWSLRFGANNYRVHSWQADNNTGFGAININPANLSAAVTTNRGIPAKQLYSEDGGCIQADLLAHKWLFDGRVESRSLATVDFNDYYRWDPNWSIGTAANNPLVAAWTAGPSTIKLGPDLAPVDPIVYFPVTWSWGHEIFNANRKTRQTVLGGLLRQQAAFFKGDLLAYGGARFDTFRYQGTDFRSAVNAFNIFPGYENYQVGSQIQHTEKLLKPNAGLNYRFLTHYRAFVNYSESYFVNQGDAPVAVADPSYKPEIAHGWDYGFKGALLDERLTFTLCGFYAVRQNVSVSDLIESPLGSGTYVTVTRRDGDQLVRGYEMDLNWRITPGLNLVGSWGHVYSIYTDFGAANPLSIGRRVNGVSPENGGISLRYAPQSASLRGFSGNIGYTYLGRTPTETPNSGDTYSTDSKGNRILTRTTRQWALSVPSISLLNVGIRYVLKSNGRYNQQIALNVNNVMDRAYLRASRQAGDHRATYITYSIGYGSLRN